MRSGSDLSFTSRHRPLLTVAGAAAGLAFWLLVEVLSDWLADRRLLAAASFAAGLFGALLLMTGPVRLMRTLPLATGMGALAALLAYWSAGRFDEVDDFLRTGHPFAALAVLILLPVPFLSAALLPGRPWRDYRVLFDLAWSAVIRAVAALGFLGVVWLFLWLSDSVLDLVGLAFLEAFVEADAAPFVLSGAVVGLGLAVAGEYGAVLSPALPLGLLRLILLPAVGVMGLFVLVLPFRGLSNAFGTLSAATVLMVMVLAGATLVSAVADRGDEESSSARVLRTGAWIMAVLMAAFAVLALYGIAERVAQYGWSPARVLAAAVGVVVAGYGFGYLGALAAGRRWMGAVRAVNVAVALLAIAVAGASLTPLLNPQRLAAEAQVARYAAGRAAPERIDLWSMATEWGRAGRGAVARLRELAGQEGVLAERFAALDAASSRFEFENGLPEASRAQLVTRFLDLVPVRPEGAAVPASVFADSAAGTVERWIEACERRTPAGNPGCAIFMGRFSGEAGTPSYVLFTLGEGAVDALVLQATGGRGSFGPTWITEDYSRTIRPGLIDALIEGRAGFEPLDLRALRFEGADLLVLP